MPDETLDNMKINCVCEFADKFLENIDKHVESGHAINLVLVESVVEDTLQEVTKLSNEQLCLMQQYKFVAWICEMSRKMAEMEDVLYKDSKMQFKNSLSSLLPEVENNE